MSKLRWTLPSQAMAVLITSGCFLISGQFLVSVHFNDVSVNGGSAVQGLFVDYTNDDSYRDHRDKIKSLADLALLGTIRNTGASSLTAEVYMMEGDTGPMSASSVRSGGRLVWGPLTVPAGASQNLTWDRSAELFGRGKAPLLALIKAGKPFTLYAIGSDSGFQFDYTRGVFVAVIAAGK